VLASKQGIGADQLCAFLFSRRGGIIDVPVDGRIPDRDVPERTPRQRDREGRTHVSLRSALVILVAALPASELKNALLRHLGWTIGDRVHIGPCLVLRVDKIDLGSGAYIGSFNVIRDLASLTLGEHAEICHWNWMSAARPLDEVTPPRLLHLGPYSNITSRHYLDCTGGIRIGIHSAIGGARSTLFTHGISATTWPARTLRKSNTHTFKPIEIGDYCLISSNVQVTPGTVVGSRIVVGMGATIAGRLLEPGLYMQSPATLVKSDLGGEYFRREEGHVDTIQAQK
jgi:acetyltransferase-like isoleucine patch superfamily enzyme